ncbi:MAG TPA: hypothetical protein VHV31_14305 [Nitrolancea sp.]|jgi:hypothetical protein|nr:hypothetical protein [Nitrolancea sp.]
MEPQDLDEPTIPRRRRLSGWAYVGIATLVLLGACFSATLAGAAYWMVNRDHHTATPTAAIAVSTPEPIAGPAIDMALPAGSTLTTRQVDDNGGNWWYENDDPNPVRVLIATSRIEQQSDLNDRYFKHVVDVVEQTAGNQVTNVDSPQVERVGKYTGEQAGYDVNSSNDGPEHAEALLLRREGDDVFIVIYGDFSDEQAVKAAARQIFSTLNVNPTPPAYDVHSV